MTNKEFCRIVAQVGGEEIDNIKQLTYISFNGEELKEWLETAIEVMSCCVTNSDEKNETQESDKKRLKGFNLETEQLAVGCDEACWYYCTKGGIQKPSCLETDKS